MMLGSSVAWGYPTEVDSDFPAVSLVLSSEPCDFSFRLVFGPPLSREW